MTPTQVCGNPSSAIMIYKIQSQNGIDLPNFISINSSSGMISISYQGIVSMSYATVIGTILGT
jgi:hypothetical protein